MNTIKVFDITGKYAVSSEDATEINSSIHKIWETEHQVVLDFKGVEVMTTNFVNAAIGIFLGIYSEDYLKGRLKCININSEQVKLLRDCIDNAKNYYKRRE